MSGKPLLFLSRCSLFSFISIIALVSPAFCEESSFLPVWRHLSAHEKQQFAAGYLQALRDTASILSITREYVSSHPELALESIEKLERMCAVGSLRPATLAEEVDSFYAKAENQNAALSYVVSTARGKYNGAGGVKR